MNWKDFGDYEELNKPLKDYPPPMVTVLCNVYNFSDFLADAFEGILKQTTDFPVEILVIDDASTDSSPEIIRDYCKKYSDKIHAFLFKENVYGTLDNESAAKHELSFLNDNLRSKYVAYCEGDDFWTDPEKLVIQIHYMEDHPDCMLTIHDAKKKNYHDGTEQLMKPGEAEHDIEPKELILQKTGIWPTASMVFRKIVALCPDWMISCGVGDWPRQLYALCLGKVHYFDRAMCVYRYMHTGSWSVEVNNGAYKMWNHASEMTGFLQKYKADYGNGYRDEITVRINRFYEYAYQALKESGMNSFDEWKSHASGKDTEIFYNTLSEVYKQREDRDYISPKLREYIENAEKIYIYGKGYYSDILTKRFKKSEIEIAGYLLSEKNEGIEDENVYTISDAPVTDNDCVVVGVGIKGYIEIKDNLQKKGVRHYVFPFVAEAENSGY